MELLCRRGRCLPRPGAGERGVGHPHRGGGGAGQVAAGVAAGGHLHWRGQAGREGWCSRSVHLCSISTVCKVAVVTGANAGIGRAVAEQLVRRGARVVMGCRDRGRAEAARQLILGNTGAGGDMVTFLHLDLASFQSVR